jgi:hypothetical protein
MAEMIGVIQQLKRERERAAKEVEQIDAALAALAGSGRASGAGNRKLSVAARARIAAAQRARWAKLKEEGKKRQSAGTQKKRTMSAGARRKIAAAQRARWAKVRARKKTA